MKTESIDILKAKIIATYRKHGDQPYLIARNRTYTGNEVADEIEAETPFGVECINNMIQLTIDLLARDKMKYPETNPYEKNIGKKVYKPKSGKPFKSGFKINTVNGVIEHPILHIPAYTFNEDESYVECRKCELVPENGEIPEHQQIRLTDDELDQLMDLSYELSWKVGTTKANTKIMNSLIEKGLVMVSTYANGDFWQLTDEGVWIANKWKP